MKQLGDTMRQVVRQLQVRHTAGSLHRLHDLIRKKRLYKMAKKLHKDIDPTLLDPAACRSVGQELDQMYKESERDLEQLIESLGNDELIQEIQKRWTLSDKELDALTISDDEVERLINSPLLDRIKYAVNTPKRPK